MESYLSVIVPVKDEAPNLYSTYQEICDALASSEEPISFEMIFVDDGSTDDSVKLIRTLIERDERVFGFALTRHFGQSAALKAGIEVSRGKYIAVLDGDLQNDPRDILPLLKKIEEGYDLVNGWRRDRKDAWLKRVLPSLAANRLIKWATGTSIRDSGCSLKIYRRELAENLELIGDMHRFIPVLADRMGARIAEVPVNHRPRVRGKSKYTSIGRFHRVVSDLITLHFFQKFLTRPMHLIGVPGCLLLALGVSICFTLAFKKILTGMELANRPLLLLGITLTITGVQLLTLGIVTEVLVRIYLRKPGRSSFPIVKEIR